MSKVNALLFKFRSFQGSVSIAGQDTAVEKQVKVVAVEVVNVKKGSITTLIKK